MSFPARFAVALRASEDDARDATQLVIEAIVRTLVECRSVTLGGLGTFRVEDQVSRAPKLVMFTRDASVHIPALRERLASTSTRPAEGLLDSFANAILAELDESGRAALVRFGTFMTHERPARSVNDPRTGETRAFRGSRTLLFSPDPFLEQRIRRDRDASGS